MTDELSDSLLARLSKEEGLTPQDVAALISHVKAPLEGFKQAVAGGQMLLGLADGEFELARRARFVRGNEEHPAFSDFSEDEKEGEARRKWYDKHVANYRALLKTSSGMFTKAAYFQGLLGEAVQVAASVRDPDEEYDEEEAEERRRELELAERLVQAAGEGAESVGKREKNRVRKMAKHGREAVNRRRERIKEIEGKAEKEQMK